ncbi:hypothetical protein KXV56_005873, partial [Aspergillus fumigatus]
RLPRSPILAGAEIAGHLTPTVRSPIRIAADSQACEGSGGAVTERGPPDAVQLRGSGLRVVASRRWE